MTSRKALVKVGIVSSVQLIDDHFPDGVAAGGASLGISVTLVGHPVVQGVGPDRDATQGGSDGGVVDKELIGHHFELLVAANSEVGSPDTDDRSVGDVGKPLNDESGAGHLSQPIIIGSLGPVLWIVLVGDGEDSDFVTPSMQFLNSGVVGVLVGDIERSLQAAAIGIDSLSVEHLLEDSDVVGVDGAVEGDGDHLRHLDRLKTARDPRSIRGAEAIWQLALAKITVRRPVGILIDGASVFV